MQTHKAQVWSDLYLSARLRPTDHAPQVELGPAHGLWESSNRCRAFIVYAKWE
jgi:hypothetical protein